ncbi:MAG: SIMPL domain-containing protein [Pseudomonadota bacterium]
MNLPIKTIAIAAIGAIFTLGNPALSQAQQAAEPKVPRFSVAGIGIVTAEPDVARISAGVVTHASEAEAALLENSKRMGAVIDALQSLGIENRKIATKGLAVTPRYSYPNPQRGEPTPPPTIVGYEVRNSVTAMVDDISKVGRILSDVVQKGANELGGITFEISKQTELLDEARAKAVADAKRKAEIYMEAAGTKLGRILTLSEQVRSPVRPRGAGLTIAATAARSAESVPVSVGEDKLSVTVNVVWEIIQ